MEIFFFLLLIVKLLPLKSLFDGRFASRFCFICVLTSLSPLRLGSVVMFTHFSLLVLASLVPSIAGDTEVVYVTDLSIFTVLAPCAQSALSYAVQALTYDECPEAVTALQDCVCNQDNNLASVSSEVVSSVGYSCGKTATDAADSAQTVLNAYCTQTSTFSFATPTVTISQFVTDLPYFEDLAPCAASAVSGVVMGMTYDRCVDDPTLFATCACGKDQNSLWASGEINTSIKYSCSSQGGYLSSAQALFAGYCGLVDGSSSFPTTTEPPGDMTYYITALEEFNSLAPCAQTAVSYDIQSQTYDLCPSGPEALASCVCLNSDMTRRISTVITSDVKYYCESTASDAISSALAVYDLYCSAAKAETTLGGITESVSETPHTGKSNTASPSETGTSSGGSDGSSSGSDGSSSSGGGSSSSGGSSSNGGTNKKKKSKSSTAAIAGGVIGAIIGAALLAVAAFLRYRKSKKNTRDSAAAMEQTPQEISGGPNNGKMELDSTTVAIPPSVSPAITNNSRKENNISPVSGYSSPHGSELHAHSPFGPPPPMPQNMSELQNQTAYGRPSELHNQTAYPRPSELQAPNAYPQETSGQQVHEAPGQNQPQYGYGRSELQGLSHQSGPVGQSYEMDGSSHGYQQPPHAT
ncbi:hypothetical protein F5Y18DRAFT_279075 [Xylariaceae sp. FL1019]|nr:hypothetical protein F5Y18DRAFT_279075 [Xylariaceae sp. FL1019]